MKNIKSTVTTRESHTRLGALLLMVLFAAGVLVTRTQAQNGTITMSGNVATTITTGAAGAQPVPDVDVSRTLKYWKKGAIAKITVRTVCPTQSFTLKVLATGVTRGSAAGEVTLVDGALDVDFIKDIPSTGAWTNATITLQFTASATFAQGNSVELGNDSHTVTFTLQVQ
ncbi:MAG: hypothetical protein NTU47_15225 [Ignavibacteriales bacterium]|nr:hypothetical protein [Ignavibacteriales bacterium]